MLIVQNLKVHNHLATTDHSVKTKRAKARANLDQVVCRNT